MLKDKRNKEQHAAPGFSGDNDKLKIKQAQVLTSKKMLTLISNCLMTNMITSTQRQLLAPLAALRKCAMSLAVTNPCK